MSSCCGIPLIGRCNSSSHKIELAFQVDEKCNGQRSLEIKCLLYANNVSFRNIPNEVLFNREKDIHAYSELGVIKDTQFTVYPGKDISFNWITSITNQENVHFFGVIGNFAKQDAMKKDRIDMPVMGKKLNISNKVINVKEKSLYLE
jgi:hypothetical protein